MRNAPHPVNALACMLASVLFLLAGLATAADVPVDAARAALRAAVRESRQAPQALVVPRDAFLQPQVASDVALSPDGRYLSFRRRGEQQTDFLLQHVASGKRERVLADVKRLETAWSGDGRYLWLADDDGLAVLEPGKGAPRRILNWDERRHQQFRGVDATATSYALVGEKIVQGGAWRYRVLLVDAFGKTRLLHESAKPLRGVLLDANGAIAFTAGYDGPQYDTVIRRHEADGASELLRCTGVEQCRLMHYDRERDELWVLAHHDEDRLALKRRHAGHWQTMHRDPMGIADASELLWAGNGGNWLAIAYHSDRRHWYGRNGEIDARLNALTRRLPEANLNLSASADGTRWLVRARHATWRVDRHYLYTPASGELEQLFADESDIMQPQPQDLSPAVPVSYRARDGMLLHGYVYLPRGVDASKVPLIAMIHGGPFNRDRDNFSPVVQLLANRGYAVFTPNFRASTGYGKRYLLASQGDFGNGAVLGDIVDGLDFLLAQGIGDRRRQAVVGHSFGGYASLLAASHYPARFSFAVAAAAPVDFSWSMEWIADNGGSALPEDGPPAEIFLAHYGVQLADDVQRQRLVRESPLANVSKLKAPLHLWAGARDDRVPLKSIIHYAAEAKRNGNALRLLIDPGSGHNPDSPLRLDAIAWLIESAAAEHFGGPVTPPDAALAAFLGKNLRRDAAARQGAGE